MFEASGAVGSLPWLRSGKALCMETELSRSRNFQVSQSIILLNYFLSHVAVRNLLSVVHVEIAGGCICSAGRPLPSVPAAWDTRVPIYCWDRARGPGQPWSKKREHLSPACQSHLYLGDVGPREWPSPLCG